MTDKLPEDITTYAKHGFLIFGDGYMAQILSMRPSTDQDDKDVYEVILKPSDEMIKAFNIKQGEPGVLMRNDGSVYVQKSIPFSFLKMLNPDPAWTRWFYLGDYNGNFSPGVKSLFKEELIKEIEDLKEKLDTERSKRAVADEKMKLMETNFPKYFARYFTPIMQDVIGAAKDILPSKTIKTE